MTRPIVRSAVPSFLQSDRRLAQVTQPIVRFLNIEAAGSILLLGATVAALVWANSPFADSYRSFWATTIGFDIGSYRFQEDLVLVVNDALMAVFFFVVGMEMKRELVAGDLQDRRAVALPAMAAIGGMVVPAAIFVAFNAGQDGARGWGIPMATDIAFALGVVALLGRRVPSAVKLMLLTLAIVDDIGAIVVIAIFYSDGLRPSMLLVSVVLAGGVAMLHGAHVRYPPILIVAALALWLVVYESGVHATIAGVVLGLLTPARPAQTELQTDEIADVLDNREDLRTGKIRETARLIGGSVSACDRLIDVLHPWTSYVIVPIFALANAGIELNGAVVAVSSRLLVGVVVALVAGKLVGIVAFSWIAVRLGIGALPDGVRWAHIVGVGATAGIGFTVSLFITGLAFDAGPLQAQAKAGVLAASLIAAVAGSVLLALASSRSSHRHLDLGRPSASADAGGS